MKDHDLYHTSNFQLQNPLPPVLSSHYPGDTLRSKFPVVSPWSTVSRSGPGKINLGLAAIFFSCSILLWIQGRTKYAMITNTMSPPTPPTTPPTIGTTLDFFCLHSPQQPILGSPVFTGTSHTPFTLLLLSWPSQASVCNIHSHN